MDEICKTCVVEYPSVECVNCGITHKNYRKSSNYDRIKNMTIEEMAVAMCEMLNCEQCPAYNIEIRTKEEHENQRPCLDNLIYWLKSDSQAKR